MKNKTKFIFFTLLILLILPALVGLIRSGFPLTDDGNWMVIRFSAFYEALRDGQFPVRFLMRLNHGYGYPVANFLYPLFMYIGVPIKAMGISFVDTIKIIMGGSLIFSGVFTYLWLKKLFTPVASFVGAICYVLFPYHLFDLYTRGSVGELLALSFIPLILWGIEKRNSLIQAIGYGFLIISHNTLALIFIPIILGYQLLVYKNNKFDIKIFISLFLGLGLSAFFWIPALYDRQFTIFTSTRVSEFSNYFVTFKNANLYGIIFIASVICGFFAVYKKKDLKAIYFLILSFLTILITTSLSSPLWNFSFFSDLIQFPFRFVSLAILSSAFLIAHFLSQLKEKRQIMFSVLILVTIFLSSTDFIFPKSIQNLPDTFYSTNQDTTTVKNEYMPKWVREDINNASAGKVEIIEGKGTINNMLYNSRQIMFDADLDSNSTIRVNAVYFPGWEVKMSNNLVPIKYTNTKGLIELELPRGTHSLIVAFNETHLRLIADAISILSVLILFTMFFRRKKWN